MIAGDSGSGNSTLLNLIAGFYDLDEGEILLNEIPVNHSNKEELYSKVGFYSQTTSF
ncbi:MAG: ATP-binding cassette domain-containing protein [Saprospirales bacterium]|nr:ATP-binding cassette domain-containing protein [Saprospirales bacterium]